MTFRQSSYEKRRRIINFFATIAKICETSRSRNYNKIWQVFRLRGIPKIAFLGNPGVPRDKLVHFSKKGTMLLRKFWIQ